MFWLFVIQLYSAGVFIITSLFLNPLWQNPHLAVSGGES
jgi:hypothetical protein